MEIDFIKSSTNKIDRYVKLYRRCFAKYPIKKNEIYFEWLYKKNPLGEFIGIDAVDLNSGEEIGQVGGVPYEFNYNGKKIKVLQSINVCVDTRYRGKKLFKEMASRLEEYAKSENYSLIIAIANKLATPAWQNSIGLKFLTQLDVLLGYGDLGLNNLNLNNSIFTSIWNQKRIEWRKNNPSNSVNIYKQKKIRLSSSSVMSIFKVFSLIECENLSINYNKAKFNFFLPNLFIGLVPPNSNSSIYFKIPEVLKPSPLNFLYKNINDENIEIKKDECFFSYLDFDAY
tara:strand:+ start:889 stop:1743 length:855 start_codon:yes stop_codon:yes gene_type:complete